VGLTVSVPPLAPRLTEVPSVPASVTVFAFVAVTFNVEELPLTMDVGFAVKVTVGAGVAAFTVTTACDEAVVPDDPVAVAV
jgi:hypothetical protein